MATETTSSEEEQEFPAPNPYGTAGVSGGVGAGRVHPESPMDGRAMRRSSRGSFTRASLEDLLSIDPEAYQSSVWLGTEDGWYGGTHTQHARMLHLHTHTHHARMLHLHAHTLCTHVTSTHTHTHKHHVCMLHPQVINNVFLSFFSCLLGSIHVYQSSDNIRNRKNSMKIQHSASILCIL